MFIITDQSLVKTVGNTTLHFYSISNKSALSSNKVKLALEELFKQIEDEVRSASLKADDKIIKSIVVISFQEELEDEEFFLASKINYRLTRDKSFLSFISYLPSHYQTKNGRLLNNAQMLIQNLFQSYRSLGKMIKSYTELQRKKLDLDVNKDELIKLVLELIQLQGFQLNDEEIMQVVREFNSLSEIASVIKSSNQSI